MLKLFVGDRLIFNKNYEELWVSDKDIKTYNFLFVYFKSHWCYLNFSAYSLVKRKIKETM